MADGQRPNVIFIMADQMKWSALRMYSEIGIETPSLERLAAEGVRFDVAITPHPLCVPARTSIMTSRYPHSTGCRRNETLMPENELHAFRIWKDAGYKTGLIGKNHCFIEKSDLDLLDVRCEISHRGLPQGNYLGEIVGNTGMEWVVPEDVINEAHATRRDMPWQSPRITYAVTDHPIEGYSSSVVTEQAEAFLENLSDDESFTLMVSYPDPHEPREAPRKYAEMFPPESVKFAPTRDDEFTDGTAPERNVVLHKMMGQGEDSEHDRRALVAVNHAMVRFLDYGIGRILDKLDELGLRDNTIVVFTSDHGDFIAEHNMSVKGGAFYDCLVRVPLIISWPGGGVPQNAVEESPLNTIDILPTLLHLQGIADFTSPSDPVKAGELPAAGPKVNPDFESEIINSEMLRRFQGKPLPMITEGQRSEASFSEYGAGGPPFTLEMLNRYPEPYGYGTLIDTLWAREAEGRRKMVRTRQWKYVTDPISDDKDELYDLQNDPWELCNVAAKPSNADVVSEMRGLLAEWMIETEDPKPVPLPTTIGRGPMPEK